MGSALNRIVGAVSQRAADTALQRRFILLRAVVVLVSAGFFLVSGATMPLLLGLAMLAYLLAYGCHWFATGRRGSFSGEQVLIPLDFAMVSLLVSVTGGLTSSAFLLYLLLFLLLWPFTDGRVKVVSLVVAMLGHSLVVRWASLWLFLYRLGGLLVAGLTSIFFGQWLRSALAEETSEHVQNARQLRASLLLSDFSRSLLAEFELPRVMQAVLCHGCRLLEAEGGWIVEQAERLANCSRAVGAVNQLDPADRQRLVADWLRQARLDVADCGELCIVDDSSVDHRWQYISCPVLTHERRHGLLLFLREERRGGFGQHDLDNIASLASTAALAIRSAELYARLQLQNAHLLLLNEIGRSLSANMDMERLFETMYREVSRVMATDAFFVGLYDERDRNIEIEYLYDAGRRYPPQVMPLNDGPTSQAIRSGQPVHWNEDARNIPGVSFVGETGRYVQSLVVVPMKQGDRVVGVVSTQSYQPNAFEDGHVELLSTVASQAAVVLSNVRLFEKTRELSLTDSMTGLANARRFYQELELVLAEAARCGGKVSLLMIDSDSLKQINDRFGHPAGDQHILTLAQIIRAQIRADDLAVRYAGDEFVVVLPSCDRPAAQQIAERIRLSVIEHYRLQGSGLPMQATVSIGIAVYPDDALTPELLFRMTDAAMYRAKQLGRNRVSAVSQ